MKSFDVHAPCETVCDEQLLSSSLWSLLCCCDQSFGSKGLKLLLTVSNGKEMCGYDCVWAQWISAAAQHFARLLVPHP